MKNKNYQITTINKLLLSAALIGSLAFFTSSTLSDNGKAGRTGAPGESSCLNSCHSSFALNSGGGSVSIQSPNTPNFAYTPGQTYNMSVTVSKTGIGLFGVGIEALTAANNNAGTLNITDAAATTIKSATVSGVSRRNIVHKLNGGAATDSKVFNFSWTAPAAGTGNITIYFAGVAANGNNNDNNDYVYTGSQIFTEACASPAQPASITGNTIVCSGSSENYSIAAVSGATTYTWNLPSGWTGTSTSTSISVVAGTSPGDITVTADNTCGSSPVTTTTVSVNAPPVPVITDNNGVLESTPAATYQWYFQGAAMSGWTNMTCIPAQLGDYTVEVTDANGCIGTSAVFTVTAVGVGEINHVKVLSVFPNPASNQVSIHATEEIRNTEFTLFDIAGSVVLKTKLTDLDNRIDLSSVSEGVYIAVAGTSANKYITRINISR